MTYFCIGSHNAMEFFKQNFLFIIYEYKKRQRNFDQSRVASIGKLNCILKDVLLLCLESVK